jgi:hypothetical protein
MLEIRIRCYNDLIKELSISTENTITLPSWYSDNISDYWDIAGLLRTISGTFSYREAANKPPIQKQADLTFIPSQSGQNISGWFFAIGESDSFSIFIESQNIAKTIYSRKGKTPLEKKLEFKGKLYINSFANSQIEQDIIENILRQYLKPYNQDNNESIDIRIRFDGRTFEILENPARGDNPPIFRGVI